MKQNTTFCIFILFISFFFNVNAAAEMSNRIVAIVGDEVITLHELNERIRKMMGLDPENLKAQNQNQYMKARDNILNLLIDERITKTKAVEMGINPTAEEVDAAIEKVKRNNQMTQEDLVQRLLQDGTSYETYREQLAEQIQRMQLIQMEVNSKIIINDEKIQEYYEKHLDEFTVDRTVRLAAIMLIPQDPQSETEARSVLKQGEELYSRLQSGEDFGELAKKYSKGPGANEGGDLGRFKLTELDPNLLEAIKGLSAGQFSKPLVLGMGVQIVKLVEKEAGGVKSMAEVKEDIGNILYREQMEAAYSVWIESLREKAYTKINF